MGGWLAIPVNHMTKMKDQSTVVPDSATQAQANIESLDKQHVCLTGEMEEWLVRLVCSLKAVAMLIKRIWTQEANEKWSTFVPLGLSLLRERRRLFTQKAAVNG